jgi:hypothetical protein
MHEGYTVSLFEREALVYPVTITSKVEFFGVCTGTNYAKTSVRQPSAGFKMTVGKMTAGGVIDGLQEYGTGLPYPPGDIDVFDSDFQTISSSLWTSWTRWSDPMTQNQVEYSFGVGTTQDMIDVLPVRNAYFQFNTSGYVFQPAAFFKHGVTYYIHVQGMNKYGVNKWATSDGIMIELTPPEVTFLGMGDTGTMTYTASTLSCNWDIIDPETGITSIGIGFGAWPASREIMDFHYINYEKGTISHKGKYSAAPGNFTRSLKSGETIFCTVEVTNTVGLSKIVSHSIGAVYDESPPVEGTVIDAIDI